MKPLQDATNAVKLCQQQVNQLLIEGNLPLVNLELNSLFQRMLTRLQYSGGVLEPDAKENAQSNGKRYGPITHIKGKPIERSQVKLEDLEPQKADIEALRARVQQLYDNILNLKTDSILSSHKTKYDQQVLRGVAKWAGIEDYEERALTEPFVNEIKEAIKKKNKDAKAQDKFKKELSTKPVAVSDGQSPNDNATEQE